MKPLRIGPPPTAIDFAPKGSHLRGLLWLGMVCSIALTVWATQFDTTGDAASMNSARAKIGPPPPQEQIIPLTPSPQPSTETASPPPPIDAAPATPPQLLGVIVEDGRRRVLLGQGEDSFVLAPGEVLPPDWRVEAIATHTVTLRHLPSGRRLQLDYEPFE